MHSYTHHMGDFNTETLHLSRLERDIYRDMRDMYFANECALDGSDMSKLAKRLRCRSDDEIAAMQFVLEEYFEQQDQGQFVHHKIERELASIKASQVDRGTVKKNENERQARSRARRSAMFSALRAKGVSMAGLSKMADLYRACAEHGIEIPADVTAPGSVTSHVTGHPVTRHADDTGNLSQPPKPLIPPNPPAGGAGAGCDTAQEAEGPGQGGGQPAAVPDPMAVATSLCAFFPEKRRTRLSEISQKLAELFAAGTVTSTALLEAASRQSGVLADKDGKACPSVLRWLRESRWLDMVAQPHAAAAGGDWSATRSGVEAKAASLGMEGYEVWVEARAGKGLPRTFPVYEAAVRAALKAQGEPA